MEIDNNIHAFVSALDDVCEPLFEMPCNNPATSFVASEPCIYNKECDVKKNCFI